MNDLKRPGRLTEKIDLIFLDKKVDQLVMHVMKNRTPGKQMFNVVHPDWFKPRYKDDLAAIRNHILSYDELVSIANEAINDHVCPSCKNDRVSKTETSCWKCGGLL